MKEFFSAVVNYVKGIERLGPGLRLFFSVSATMLWTGIWLTGFGVVHWVLFIPPVSFTFAVITRICPGKILSELTVKSFATLFPPKPNDA